MEVAGSHPTLPSPQSKSFKVQPESIGYSESDLGQTFKKEPLPIFHALVLMLVNPQFVPRGASHFTDFNFQRMLESAFTENDNPYLANTFYQYEDGEKFSALDRLNHLWYLMFSGFTLDDLSIASSIDIREATMRPELDADGITLAYLASCHSYFGLNAPSLVKPPTGVDFTQSEFENQSRLEMCFWEKQFSVTPSMDMPKVDPIQEKRLELSRGQFLSSIPNPAMIFKGLKSQQFYAIVLTNRKNAARTLRKPHMPRERNSCGVGGGTDRSFNRTR